MIDYPQKQFDGYDWTESDKEIKPGILNAYLNPDGYPSFRSSIVTSQLYPGASSLHSYFSGAKAANHLFVTETYENSGYYEFDSQKNGASFDETTGNFTLYQQLPTPSDSDIRIENLLEVSSEGSTSSDPFLYARYPYWIVTFAMVS